MKKKSRGFTLVELLVAVAILAIIVSIAFALYNNFSKGAKETATVITKQNLVSAAQLYAKEFKTNHTSFSTPKHPRLSATKRESGQDSSCPDVAPPTGLEPVTS